VEINGDLKSIKAYIVADLEALYDQNVPPGQISTHELNAQLLNITQALDREIAVYINRQGKILQVSVGNNATVDLPEFKAAAGKQLLSGIRCIHTHPSGESQLSEPDLSSLQRMHFDVMAAISYQSQEIIASMAFFTGQLLEDGHTPALQFFGPVKEEDLHQINLTYLIAAVNKQFGRQLTSETKQENERAILAGIEFTSKKTSWAIEDSMAELARLAETAGAIVVGQLTQRKEKPDNALFLGKGKVQEVALAIQNNDANLLIFDDEITPSQQRNLERMLGVKILDRTALILDIFAQRAHSREGKLQVELAQLQYNLPRIGGQGLVLSRLGGGIGTRGPGETKLEVDRRRIYTRIHDIEEQISRLKKHRALHHQQRKEMRMPLVALVGYTNAGKSTLLNALSGADVFAEDKLFATLDPTTRLVNLSDHQQILLTDTVGFIQKLPHTLVTAFNATLEEVCEADLLLHVVDCSNANYEQQVQSVIAVLTELKAENKPVIYVFNKADQIADTSAYEKILQDHKGIFISARERLHLDDLLAGIAEFVGGNKVEMQVCIPFSQGNLITRLHQIADIRQTDYTAEGTVLQILLPADEVKNFEPYKM
jgi:GTPase